LIIAVLTGLSMTNQINAIHLEAEAVKVILKQCEQGYWQLSVM
jgi:hypothetical protein